MAEMQQTLYLEILKENSEKIQAAAAASAKRGAAARIASLAHARAAQPDDPIEVTDNGCVGEGVLNGPKVPAKIDYEKNDPEAEQVEAAINEPAVAEGGEAEGRVEVGREQPSEVAVSQEHSCLIREARRAEICRQDLQTKIYR